MLKTLLLVLFVVSVALAQEQVLGPAAFTFPAAGATFRIPARWDVKYVASAKGFDQFTFNSLDKPTRSLTVTINDARGRTPQKFVSGMVSLVASTISPGSGRKMVISKQEPRTFGGRAGYFMAYLVEGSPIGMGPTITACVPLDANRLLALHGTSFQEGKTPVSAAQMAEMEAILQTLKFTR